LYWQLIVQVQIAVGAIFEAAIVLVPFPAYDFDEAERQVCILLLPTKSKTSVAAIGRLIVVTNVCFVGAPC
jgi:hypothetical protein